MRPRTWLRALVLAAALATLARPGTGHAYEWLGGQVKTFISGGIELNETTTFNATLLYFWVPSSGGETLFTYFGPVFKLGGSGWIAPMMGIVGGIPAEEDSPMFTLWAGTTMDKLSLFLGGDLYVDTEGEEAGDDSFVHYIYGSADYALNGWLSAGLMAEEFDGVLTVGPQVSLRKAGSPWKLVGQYHHINEDLGDEPKAPSGHFLRLMTFLNF